MTALGRRALAASFVAWAAACGSGHTRTTYAVVSAPRDWTAHPAVLEIDALPPDGLYAISDVHGGADRMKALFAAHHLVEGGAWVGGAAVLVVVGDVFDKGPSPLEAIDLLRAVEPEAEAAGGRVVVTLGNHEAEFFDDPLNDKAESSDGVDREIEARGLTPVGVADGSDPRGAWLRDRPFAARVGRWFFAHAGDTGGHTIAELDAILERGVTAHDYDDPSVVGPGSILESRGWYASDATTASRYAAALGVGHVVFGHQPDALGARGEIAVAFDGALFRIDCGMSPDVDDSEGRMLRIRREAGTGVDVAESLAPDGSAREIWRGP